MVAEKDLPAFDLKPLILPVDPVESNFLTIVSVIRFPQIELLIEKEHLVVL